MNQLWILYNGFLLPVHWRENWEVGQCVLYNWIYSKRFSQKYLAYFIKKYMVKEKIIWYQFLISCAVISFHNDDSIVNLSKIEWMKTRNQLDKIKWNFFET